MPAPSTAPGAEPKPMNISVDERLVLTFNAAAELETLADSLQEKLFEIHTDHDNIVPLAIVDRMRKVVDVLIDLGQPRDDKQHSFEKACATLRWSDHVLQSREDRVEEPFNGQRDAGTP